MAPYSQDELEAMLADLESDLVERKESLQGDNPRKVRQAVCAFANDLPDHQRSGIVFVGADDAGTPVGLEITSPGGPYGALTRENFGQPGIVDYRNQILAEAMRVLGLAQRFGAGIPTARRALLDNGQPAPDFGVEPNWIHCTVRARIR